MYVVQSLEIEVNGDTKDNGSTVSFATSTGENIYICCYYDITLRKSPPTLYEIFTSGILESLRVSINRSIYGRDYLNYSVPHSKKQNIHKYRCATNYTFTEVELKYCKFCSVKVFFFPVCNKGK